MENYAKETKHAQDFLLKSKEAFAAKIARNKVNNIDFTVFTRDEAYTEAVRFLAEGSVETTSPTGKLKTYRYNATIDVNGKDCKFASLDVLPLEE